MTDHQHDSEAGFSDVHIPASDIDQLLDMVLLGPENEVIIALRLALADLRIGLLPLLLPVQESGSLLVVGAGQHPIVSSITWDGPIHILASPLHERPETRATWKCEAERSQILDSWQEADHLSFIDHACGGILLLPFGPHPPMIELARILSPGGFILSVNTVEGFTDFRTSRIWTVQQDNMNIPLLFDHSNPSSITTERHRLPLRLRHMPTELLVKMLRHDVTCRSSLPVETRLDRLFTLARKEQPSDALKASLPIVQVKNKLTVKYSIGKEAKSFLKIPLTTNSSLGLQNAADILRQLHESLPPEHELRVVIPSSVTSISCGKAQAWLESSCPGSPLSEIKNKAIRLQAAQSVARLIRSMTEISEKDIPKPRHDFDRVANQSLTRIAASLGQDASEAMKSILSLIDAQHCRLYLRKGDFSLNNVLIQDNRISGLIDWDESGTTAFPQANLADFIMSWLWQVEGMSRSESLQVLMSGTYPLFSSGFNINQLLEITRGSPRDLALGSIGAWLDHVYHELKHPSVRAKPARIMTLLDQPIKIVSGHLSRWSS